MLEFCSILTQGFPGDPFCPARRIRCILQSRLETKNPEVAGLQDFALICPFGWWEQRESNPRPSACKADALNQLSYAPFVLAGANIGQIFYPPKKIEKISKKHPLPSFSPDVSFAHESSPLLIYRPFNLFNPAWDADAVTKISN